ncbi:MAG: hypothetical protein SGJ21_00285 [Alphaproteobacteria bacterium]|nr:hypothetical protein [Alphaproteobacteria bacterium]
MRLAVILALGTALYVAPMMVAGQQDAAAQNTASAYKAPRTGFGQPDLSGTWSNSTLTPMTRPASFKDRLAHTEDEVKKLEAAVVKEVEEGNAPTDPDAPAEYRNPTTNERPEFRAAGGAVGGYNRGWLDPGNLVMRVNGEPRTSLITTPDGRPPARKANAPRAPAALGGSGGEGAGPLGSFDSYETRSLGERCVIGFGRNAGPPMFPNGFYNNNYQIVQSPDAVMIQVEMNHDARIVRLNSKHNAGVARPYFGDSIGRWEGDTLVVETINIPRSQAFMGSWENLKVTERFTRVGAERLHYKFTVEDSAMWEQPWGGEYEFAPLNGRIYEYACHEGNYALPGILSGARVEEAAKARKSGAKPGR